MITLHFTVMFIGWHFFIDLPYSIKNFYSEKTIFAITILYRTKPILQ